MADFKTRKLLTNGLFMSKLAYLMPLWGGCHKFLINTLQVLQNRAARFVTKQNMYSPVQNLLKECGWLSVHQMVFYHTVVLFFKIRKNGSPVVLYKMATADYAYDTRSKTSGNIKVSSRIKVPSDLAARSFRWRSVSYWNLLPSKLKSIQSVNQFKQSLKSWIIMNVKINP